MAWDEPINFFYSFTCAVFPSFTAMFPGEYRCKFPSFNYKLK